MKPSMLHQMQGRSICHKWATNIPGSPNHNGESGLGSCPMDRQECYLSVEAWLKQSPKARTPGLRRHLQLWYRQNGASLVYHDAGEPDAMREGRLALEQWATWQAWELDQTRD